MWSDQGAYFDGVFSPTGASGCEAAREIQSVRGERALP